MSIVIINDIYIINVVAIIMNLKNEINQINTLIKFYIIISIKS